MFFYIFSPAVSFTTFLFLSVQYKYLDYVTIKAYVDICEHFPQEETLKIFKNSKEKKYRHTQMYMSISCKRKYSKY